MTKPTTLRAVPFPMKSNGKMPMPRVAFDNQTAGSVKGLADPL
jgi:hypothetical protein